MLLKLGFIGSLAGCVLVSFNQPLLANIVWIILNPCMLIHNLRIKEYAQATLWGIYILIAAAGIVWHYVA